MLGQKYRDREIATGQRKVCSESYARTRSDACARPAPELHEANQGIWEVFQRCRRGRGLVYASAFGFDSVPRGIRPEAAEKAAQSAGVPWTEEAVERFEYLEDAWIAELDRQLAERKEQMDLERQATNGR